VIVGPRTGLEDRLLKPWAVYREDTTDEDLVQGQEMTDLVGYDRNDRHSVTSSHVGAASELVEEE
jgi:hypothetical protein